MAKYTDKDYFIETRLVPKLNKLCARVSENRNNQNVIICDGKEGFGKSTLVAGVAYYMSWKLKRKVYLTFDMEVLKNLAINNDNLILIWDDAAYSALSFQAYNTALVNFIKVLLLARKKRHTYFINIQEVWRLKEPISRRAHGLFNVYSRDGGLTIGRFRYYGHKKIKAILDNWFYKKKRKYGVSTVRGTFPNILYKIFDEKEYEKLKDYSIQNIGKEVEKPKEKRKMTLGEKYSANVKKSTYEKLKEEGWSDKKIADLWSVSKLTLITWRQNDFTTFYEDPKEEKVKPVDDIIINGYVTPKETIVLKPTALKKKEIEPVAISSMAD